MEIKKNQEYIVEIIDNGCEGEGITKINGFTVFVPGAIKGEKIKILIVKVLKSHAYGKILEIVKKSSYRTEQDCSTYKRCGGCNLRHIDYEYTLNIKQNMVQNLVDKNLREKIKTKLTWAMGNPYYYRNKLQYPIGVDKNSNPIVGVFASRTHEIIPVKECLIQDREATEISKYIANLIGKYKLSVYNENTNKGLFRHIVIKTGFRSGERMVILVVNGEKIPFAREISSSLQEKYPSISSVVLNVNKKKTNVILGEKNINIVGNGYIEDQLGEFTFKISPLSFYQVNPVQAEALYNIAIENTGITKK